MDKINMPEDMKSLLAQTSYVQERCDVVDQYAERHNIASAAVLTVCDDELAASLALRLAPRIVGKTIVEIGGGIGLLAFHLGEYAKRVYCIEANPLWSATFVGMLFSSKPKNVSYLFGAADEFAGAIQADIALYCSHSGLASMRAAGLLFAPDVIDVYGELIATNPDTFDLTARLLRGLA